MIDKKKVGRPSLFPASYVHDIAEQLVRQSLKDDPKTLKKAVRNKRDYLATLKASERVLQAAVRVRHALLVEKEHPHATYAEIAYQMFRAARPDRYTNRKRYAREESDETWVKTQKHRIENSTAGLAFHDRYLAVMEAKRRVDESDPVQLVAPEFIPAKRKPRATTTRKPKLLPDSMRLGDEEDFI